MVYVPPVLLFLFLSILGAVRASYFIDDADPLVQYVHDSAADWSSYPSTVYHLGNSNGSAIIMDYSRMYNGTVTFGHCNASQPCEISIPFTGSGITLFGGSIPVLYTNFTVTLDGSPAPPPVLQTPPPAGEPYVYNITLYDLQSVEMIHHVLTINLVQWVGRGYSEILFDSALINETVPATSTSSIPTSTSTSTSTASSSQTSAGISTNTSTKSRPILGIALGTTIGVLALVIAAGLALFYRYKTRTNRAAQMAQTGARGGENNPIRPAFDPYPTPIGGNIGPPMHNLNLPTTPPSANLNTGHPLTPTTADHLLQPQSNGYMMYQQPPPSPPFQQPYYGMQPPPAGENMGRPGLLVNPDYGSYRQNLNAGPVQPISPVMNLLPGQTGRYPEL